MTFEELWPVNFRTALIVVGFVCVVLGLLFRDRGISNRGLSMALIVVGVMMMLAAPGGRMLDWW